MEKWIEYKIKLQIDVIDSFVGGNQELHVNFQDIKKSKWALHFDEVWDFRYAIENAFIDRCYNMRQQKAWIGDNSIYVVENSEYIQYFKKQVSGTRSVEDLQHYIIFDKFDTGLEILTLKEPTLIVLEL